MKWKYNFSEKYSSYRKNIIVSKLNTMGVYPLDIMVAGVTGAGKSTTLNTFFQKAVAKVGDGVDPETMNINSYKLSDHFRIWDTPGLGDGVIRDQQHKKSMIDLLYRKYRYHRDNKEYALIDMCLVILEGSNRDMGTTYTLLNDVIVPNIQSNRILVAINQADVAMKGRHWNSHTSSPDNVLLSYLNEQALSVKRRVKEATGVNIKKPICYSAKYDWNVDAVFDMIIDNIPSKRRTFV